MELAPEINAEGVPAYRPPVAESLPASVAQRRLVPEVMDDPELDPALHTAALRGLGRINRVSRSAAMLWPAIVRAYLIQRDEKKLTRPFRVLDLACGGGDVGLALARKGARLGVAIEFVGADVSPVALDFARQQADAAKYRLSFRQLDVLQDDLPEDIDVAMNSLFMHHLTAEQAVAVMSKMKAAADTVLINDLRRSAVAHAMTVAGTRVLSRSPVVHVDGPRSVRAAWTPPELLALAERSGLHSATVRRRFPWRMLLQWQRDAAAESECGA